MSLEVKSGVGGLQGMVDWSRSVVNNQMLKCSGSIRPGDAQVTVFMIFEGGVYLYSL